MSKKLATELATELEALEKKYYMKAPSEEKTKLATEIEEKRAEIEKNKREIFNDQFENDPVENDPEKNDPVENKYKRPSLMKPLGVLGTTAAAIIAREKVTGKGGKRTKKRKTKKSKRAKLSLSKRRKTHRRK